MILYRYPLYLQHSEHPAFEQVHQPSTPAPYSGIYRCEGCGKNATCVAGWVLPPSDHHLHVPEQGPIRWRLAATHG